MDKRNRKKHKLLKELEKTPLIEQACRKAGISRATYYRWCVEDRAFYYRAEAAKSKGREKLNDYVESKLLENIGNGHQGAIQFWLCNNSKAYNPDRMSRAEQIELRKHEALKRNKEIAESLDLDEAVALLGGDPKILALALKAALEGEYKWMVLHDPPKDV
jgi:hypothetical protein